MEAIMDMLFFNGTYREFRNGLQGNAVSPDEMAKAISASIGPIARTLNIGLIKASVMSPSDKNSQNGNWTLFEAPEGAGTAALIETYRTGDNGLVNFSANPLKGHKFTEEEVRAIKVLAQDIFNQLERSLLTALIIKARITDSMTGIPNSSDLMQKGLNLKIAKKLSKYTGIFINLKNYKYINDTLGGMAGDQGIIAYAKAAHAFIKDKGEIARLGGDNFFALVLNRASPIALYFDPHRFCHATMSTGSGPSSGTISSKSACPRTAESGLPSSMASWSTCSANGRVAFFVVLPDFQLYDATRLEHTKTPPSVPV